MENLPNSLLNYHYKISFPEYLNSRPKHIAETLASFNISGLLKNIFAPYKRMVATGKTTFLDRLSFNLISAGIGATARLGLIVAGLLVTVLVSIFDLFSLAFYLAIPLFSYSKFHGLKQNSLFKNDLANAQSFLNKIASGEFFAILTSFFEPQFKELFKSLPDPNSLKVKEGTSIGEVFKKLYLSWPSLKKYFADNTVNTKNWEILVTYIDNYLSNHSKPKTPPLGQSLIYGYTNTLDKFGRELSLSKLQNSKEKETLLMAIEKVLSRPHNNNVLLVGDEGVGKHTVLETLVTAIERQKLPSLSGKRVILLDTINLIADAPNLQDAKANVQSVFIEAKNAGNIILAIDEIDKISSNLEGRVDLSEVLNNVLTDNSLPIIGIASLDEFNQFIRPNALFLSLFEKIEVQEATNEETISILIDKTLANYKKEKISATLDSLVEIVDLSTKLIPQRKQPEKSILLLEDSFQEAKRKKLSQVDKKLVDEILSLKTKTPVGTITQTEADKLKNLEAFLHRRVIGQDEAIVQLAKALRRARAEIRSGTRPIGSFLFLGPTGVGKTETAKALAETYFGHEDRMTRLDMSEYQDDKALPRLIGNADTKAQGYLSTLINNTPYGLLLLDEFEKANKDVQNLFLQILDEGNLTDAFGKKVSFTNIIIIATSNAAAEFIREEVEKKDTFNLSQKLIDYVLSQNLFPPELLNRFDGVVVYHPLNNQEIVEVTKLMLGRLSKDLKISKNITLEVSPNLAEVIAKEGYVTAFGARPIKRLIADRIEDYIAKIIIAGEIKSGQTITSNQLLSLF